MSALLAQTTEIEVDSTPFSDYETDGGSELSTQSLSSSIREHVYENGRRYHRKSAGQYFLPSDETEQDRLDLLHHLYTLVRGGALYMAPLREDPARVLDAGTGTGVWALDFGDIHPGSEVVGVDLAPIQPDWTFPNVKFECDDLEKDWTWKLNHFNYIHSRALATAIKDWSRYFTQCFRHTAPGGYIEIVEYALDRLWSDDDTLKDSALEKFMAKFSEGLSKSGINVHVDGEYIKKGLEEAGFTDVQVHPARIPCGAWPKEPNAKRVGATQHLNLQTGLEAHGLNIFTQVLEMTVEEANELIAAALKDVERRKVHSYTIVWNVVARKPE
ncbi:S-adenosyl-L-methionine-dependent methyltransferase [Ascodesmis nigricans]|uniref:S-adenosyl-L-methionine-dependent methyltransferase n=1 Tax=Ascodesmis nigricans TaxID=341454 RepID=A0A4S2MQK2_9PEZI|nr:S-adenosyl-L-methionine-dependent methyltransferase [Ascodesmis nigricans]